ncbi:MAG TPA: tetratricopeptide repeat protein [Thermoguttaceae bacterium]|nr:tetratricopeptide repeat protein [Thermoguttaceae bacterium]
MLKSRKALAFLAFGVVAIGAGVLGALWITSRAPPVDVDGILAAYREDGQYGELAFRYPLDETLFPPEIVAPTFRWEDTCGHSDTWVVTISFRDGEGRMSFPSSTVEWTPSDEQWETIKRRSLEKSAKVTVLGVNRTAPERILSAASVSIAASKDEVGAPIFYREVILPLIEAVKDPSLIRWRFGEISSKKQPEIVLENLPVCGNCHSFSADGGVLGMDVDYANDKGSYVIKTVSEEMTLDKSSIITWSDYEKEDGRPTFGLLSRVSPDGKYTVSTVKDQSVFVPKPGLAFSQLFFPIQGILAVYSRETGTFRALPGADDEQFVQSNPIWSPDGKHIVFARSKAYRLENARNDGRVLLTPEECDEFLVGGKEFLFDLYRIPFNEGEGGNPEPLEGASHNGMSNYFAKYSPDGKWIVFCKAKSYMLLQPDSELYIIPASGGKARRLRCNTGRMNSWHSWSPNGKWLVFSSKANSDYTQLFLTHIDEQGRSSPAVVLSQFTAADRAANIPEFVHPDAGAIKRIREQFVDDDSYRRAGDNLLVHDPDDAVERYRNSLEINPNNARAHRALGTALAMRGMLEEARAHFVEAIRLEPEVAEAHGKLGVVLQRLGKFDQAVEPCRAALRIDPQDPTAHVTLGVVLLELGNPGEAKAHLSEAVRIEPNDLSSRYKLVELLLGEGKPGEAVPHLRRVLNEKPDFVPALLKLASIRATSEDSPLRDVDEAIQLASRACELTQYRNPTGLMTLSGAYYEAGRFADAISTAEQALWIARHAGDKRSANAIQQHIASCKQRAQASQPDSR